jgi:hypothetical protein
LGLASTLLSLERAACALPAPLLQATIAAALTGRGASVTAVMLADQVVKTMLVAKLRAFVLALMEMVVQGVSTRKVSTITEELCGASFCKSTVSALCTGLDARVRWVVEVAA